MDFPVPDINDLNRPYWDGLKEGRLLLPRCACGHAWLPVSLQCPRCLTENWQWEKAAGTGRLVSWVVYHHSYHDAFRHRLPYNVALVELDEGPRLITNMTDPSDQLRGDAAVVLDIGWEGNLALARFRLAANAPA